MTTITIQLPEAVVDDLQEYAKRTSRDADDVIREALENYRNQKSQLQESSVKKTHSLLDHEPLDLGEILKPWSSRAELLEDFFDRD